MSQRVAFKLGEALSALHGPGCRHDQTRGRVLGLLRCGKQGQPGVKRALMSLREAFVNVVGPDRPGGREEAIHEFRSFIYRKQPDGGWVFNDNVARLLADDSYDDDTGTETGSIANEPGGGDEPDDATTWEPVDLSPWLRGEIEQPRPTIGIARSDGLRVIYPGREHAILGETESGKTWLALGCVAAELIAGNTVVYIHYEEGDPGSTLERLQLLGLPPEMISGRLRFVAPSRPVQADWVKALLDPPPALVIHDGVNEAMSLIGADIKEVDGASTFRRRLVTAFRAVGAATIACDHMPLARDPARRDAYGSVHKGNALDGARIMLENVEPFGRNMRGVSHVFVTKDRPGHLRANGRATKTPGKTYVGTLVVDDMVYGPNFAMLFWAPKDDEDSPAPTVVSGAELADMVYDVIVALPEGTVASARMLYAEMRKAGQSYRDGSIRQVVDDLIVAGRLIEVPGKHRATGYRAIATAAGEPSA